MKKEIKKVNKNDEMFRQASLKKLASPEHLDKLIRVTDSKGWLALLAALALVIVTLIWSVVVSLPTKVQGRGILIKSGGVRSIQHSHGGVITDVAVREGDVIKKGQVIARVAAKDLIASISNANFELKTMIENFKRYEHFENENMVLKESYFSEAISSQNENLRDFKRSIEEQKREIEAKKELLNKGSLSREELRLAIQNLDRLEASRDSIERELKQLQIERLEFGRQIKDNTIKMKNEIESKKSEILFLKDQLDEKSKILSPYSGRVVSSIVEKGKIITPGESLVIIELDGASIKHLECIVFVPAMEAKEIELGMEAQVSPASVNASEYGVILGRVTKVTEYPVSYEYIAKTLGAELAKDYIRIQDPIEVVIDLIPDYSNKSKYRWSSRKGPPIEIKTGTPAVGAVVIKRKKPITFVFPILSGILEDKNGS